jgi:hypothetical protein
MRLQDSPSAQTLLIAYLAFHQDLFAKTLSMAAQMNFIGATGPKKTRPDLLNFFKFQYLLFT